MAQWARKRGIETAEQSVDQEKAKTELPKAIWRSRLNHWEDVRNMLNNDIWGLNYKTVIRHWVRLSAVSGLSKEQMKNIVDKLFPNYPIRT